MTYRITFFDKSSIKISDKEFEYKVKQAIANKIQFFAVELGIFATSSIAKVEKHEPKKLMMLASGVKGNDITINRTVSKETLEKVRQDLAERFNWN